MLKSGFISASIGNCFFSKNDYKIFRMCFIALWPYKGVYVVN